MAAETLAHGRSRSRGGVPVWGVALAWMVLWTGVAALLHHAQHGVVNGLQLVVATFLSVNVLIALWEIVLLLRIDLLEARYRERRERSESAQPSRRGGRARGERRRGRSFFLSGAAPRDLVSATFWSQVWSEYAKYDPSYADRRSFGFAIDVGNGFSTLLPSLVFLVGMTFPILSPLWLGIVGGLVFYQKFYGTALYFFTFVFNRRYEGHDPAAVWTFVGAVNGVWMVFPAFGLYVCYRLVADRSFDVLWS